ncbi:25S rRNA (cytosine-C(5))-methyltransferase NSUN5 [Impatiens glandulifera]|uniref:25S rRNA (cytosine-C(5))-methyltransferase NSUN5 n=1 Tax=Impatiens glandulifera TaxID=253017 RepID=UPI001FB17DB2|nr:25S rRNA (cytosine-C(5))-methyltransferase NSUN5 [Impatiens glandulifera]
MRRLKTSVVATKPATGKPATGKTADGKPATNRRQENASRSAYFARREAANVLRTVLQGDARRQAVASIKSLVYSPSVRNKRGTLALVCQTLKHFSFIKEVLETPNILNSKWKRQWELMCIITYDILFGQAESFMGDAEKFLILRKDALQLALAQLLKRKGVKNVKQLMEISETSDIQKPRYVRVNTLKSDVKTVIHELGKLHTVHKDDMIEDLLVLPPGADLHDHPLVTNGSIFLQGKASCISAAALQPEPGWEVLDACAAPGNKTVYLAAIMKGKGKIIACERNKERVELLRNTVALAGATNVDVMHTDFLSLNPDDPVHAKIRAILVDPSCSGSGTTNVRLDHLLPSYNSGKMDADDIDRVRKLQSFQKKVLAHALSFPGAERVVYSTCSIHQIENEDVISSLLPLAVSHGFQLATVFPQWPRRGLPVVEGSEHLLRIDPVEDKEGFFVALFVREGYSNITTEEDKEDKSSTVNYNKPSRIGRFHCPFVQLPKTLVYPQFWISRRRRSNR